MPSQDTDILPTQARKEPLYKSLIAAMRQRIESGLLPPGAKAPSESDLIAEFRVSSTTARRCLDELERIHLVRRVQGKGTFVTSRTSVMEHRQIGLLYNELFSLAEGILSHIFRGVGPAMEPSDIEPMLLAAGALRRSGKPADALRDMIHQHRLEALFVMSPLPLPWFRSLLDEGLPVGSVNFAYADPRIFSATMDAQSAVKRIGGRLREFGHQHVVSVRRTFSEDFLDGVLLNPWDMTRMTALHCATETFPYFGPDQTQELVDRCLARTPRPTAFVTSGYEIALRVRHAVKARGLSVPQDISVMFFGAPPGPSEIDGEIVPIEQMSQWTTQALLDAVAGSPPDERVMVFQSHPQSGLTLARASGFEAAPSSPRRQARQED